MSTLPALDWTAPFLQILAQTGNVGLACDAAGINRTTARKRRQSDAAFRERWANAIRDAQDVLELEARRRALGYVEPAIHQGKYCVDWIGPDGLPCEPNTPGAVKVPVVVHKYSEKLLLELMRAGNKAKFGSQESKAPSVNVQVNVAAVAQVKREQIDAMLEELFGPEQPAPASPIDTSREAAKSATPPVQAIPDAECLPTPDDSVDPELDG